MYHVFHPLHILFSAAANTAFLVPLLVSFFNSIIEEWVLSTDKNSKFFLYIANFLFSLTGEVVWGIIRHVSRQMRCLWRNSSQHLRVFLTTCWAKDTVK